MALIVSERIATKLSEKHKVTVKEVNECLSNRQGNQLEDTREGNVTDPPTLWFISLTNKSRCLKIIYVISEGDIYLKSAFDADENAKRIYAIHG